MLLFIALANTVWYLWAAPTGGLTAHPEPEGAPDAAAQFFTMVAVDSRSYPMFAFLFGYGIVRLATRQEAAGADPKDVSALLRRRNLWLLGFGFVHALLLWFGDVLGAYGLAGLVLCWLFLRRRDTTLLVWAGALTGIMVLLSAVGLLGLVFQQTGTEAATSVSDGVDMMAGNIENPSVIGAALGRITVWPVVVLGQGLVGLVVPTVMLLGFWAARHRILEEPGRHLVLLRLVAFVGVPAGWLGGVPTALAQIGVWDRSPGDALAFLDLTAGMVGGLGYVALITLIAHRIQRRGREPGVVLTALTATGKRSLSCYLGQSVLCAPLLSAWGLGLAVHLTSWSMVLFAVGVWLVTVVTAYVLERAGRRGPAEVLLRRLSYRRPLGRQVAGSSDDTDQERTTR